MRLSAHILGMLHTLVFPFVNPVNQAPGAQNWPPHSDHLLPQVHNENFISETMNTSGKRFRLIYCCN